MQPDIQIKVNNQLMDFDDSEQFPLTITKETDKFLELIGATGSTARNSSQSLILPASKRNSIILENIHIPNAVKPTVKELVPISIVVNGSALFNGVCTVKRTRRSAYHPEVYELKLQGDGRDVWALLEDVNLRDIPMGEVLWTNQNITDSWTGSVDTGWAGVFAPVVYGATKGGRLSDAPGYISTGYPSTQDFQTWFTPLDFRFDVYFYHIFKSIMDYIGYSFESDFFEDDYFKDWVDVFTAGDTMKTDYDVSGYKAIISITTPTGLPFAGFNVYQPIPLNIPVYDPMGIYDLGTNVATLPVTGRYLIEWFVGLDQLILSNIQQRVRMRITDPSQSNCNDNFEDFEEEIFMSLNDKYIVENSVTRVHSAGTTIELEAISVGINTTFIINKAYLRITLLQDAVYDSPMPISVQSCLPDVKAKDWLRAITHLFGLAWFCKTAIKRVYVEPRFDSRIQSTEGNFKDFKGFYNNPIDNEPTELCVDGESIELPITDGLGDYVKMSFKEDDDPLYQYYKARNSNPQTPLYGFNYEFLDRCKNGTVSENPVYTNLFQCQTNFDGNASGLLTGTSLPYVLPSDYSIEDDLKQREPVPNQGELYASKLPEPTYSAEPKCGRVYRNTVPIYYLDCNDANQFPDQSVGAPLIIQQPIVYALSNELWTGGYSDVTAFNSSTVTPTRNVRGFGTSFWIHYLGIMREAELLKGRFDINGSDVSQENFRQLKRVQIGYEDTFYILRKIDKYKPTKVESTTCELIKYIPLRSDFLNYIAHNDLQKQVLTIIKGTENPEDI